MIPYRFPSVEIDRLWRRIDKTARDHAYAEGWRDGWKECRELITDWMLMDMHIRFSDVEKLAATFRQRASVR